MPTEYDLDRFVIAQDGDGVHSDHATALAELKAENKTTHWIWYVLPQLEQLGTSDMAKRYGIADLGEAKAYLDHPVLGERLRECVRVLQGAKADDAAQIVGDGDARKLHSSLTLFHRAAPADPLFTGLLEKYYGGREDHRTVELLRDDA